MALASPMPSAGPELESLKAATLELLQDRDLTQITIKKFRVELEHHFGLPSGALESRKEEVFKIVQEATQYLIDKDVLADFHCPSFPTPLLCVRGTVLDLGQRRAKVAFNAGTQALSSFTVDFCFLLDASKGPGSGSSGSAKILSHCNGRSGFRVQLESGRLQLLLFSPTQTIASEISAGFDWRERSQDWTRVTCTVESEKGVQTGELFLDGKLCVTKHVPQASRYQDCDQRFLLVGCGRRDMQVRDLKLFSGAVEFEEIGHAWQNELSQEHLVRVASSLWQTSSFGDCRILADDGKTWEVHRCVLSASSPVFLRMFQADMKEAREPREVKLKNSSSADIGAFLHFLYVGRLPTEPSFSVTGVMELADMYDLPGLVQTMCVEVEKNLTPETVNETLRLLKKREASSAVAATYRRVRRKVHANHDLLDGLLDSL